MRCVAQAFVEFKQAASSANPSQPTPSILKICIKKLNRLQFDRNHTIKVTKAAKAALETQVEEKQQEIKKLESNKEPKDAAKVTKELVELNQGLKVRNAALQTHGNTLAEFNSNLEFCTTQVNWIRAKIAESEARCDAASAQLADLTEQDSVNEVNLVRNTHTASSRCQREEVDTEAHVLLLLVVVVCCGLDCGA